MDAKQPLSDDSQRQRKRWRWLRHDAIDLGDMVVQIIAVMVGILLALLINDWVTNSQQQATVDEAMRAIRAELTANRAALHKNATRLEGLATALLDSPKNQDQSARPCYLWDQWNGPGPANITQAGYQTSITTQAIANMPFQQAQLVAEVYGAQRNRQKGSDLIFNKLMSASPQTLGICVSFVENIAYNDHSLADAYTPLIGPDKTKWSNPPAPFPSTSPPNTSK